MKRVLLALLLLCGCAHASHAPLPIVFVHGNGANAHQWRHQVEYFGKTRGVTAVELRGKPGNYTLDAFADDVEAAANAAGFKRFVLVGHSFGGAVVATYAARHPDRVAALVFADSAGNVSVTDEQFVKFDAALRKDPARFVRAWFAPILKASSDEVRNEVFASVAATNINQFAAGMADLRGMDMKALLAAYPGPKFAIAAADIENPASFHVQFPEVPVAKITGTGHWLMLDKPDEFNAALEKFLASIPD
jgi:pimeloyl-ACP methyl ester carboxylesterase